MPWPLLRTSLDHSQVSIALRQRFCRWLNCRPALAVLIFETHNDYVRFHGALKLALIPSFLSFIYVTSAYQSALLSTPLGLVRILVSLLGFPSWLRTFFTFALIIPLAFMTYVCLPYASVFRLKWSSVGEHLLMLPVMVSQDFTYQA